MKLEAQAVKKTLELARQLGLLDAAEVRDVMAAFDAQYPFAASMRLADTLHVHVKVDAVHALPASELRAAGGTVENETDGYVKYAFPSGMNLIFSSINVSEDDLRATLESQKRPKPFLDHYGIDLRAETPDVKATFDAIPSHAKAGLGHGAAGRRRQARLLLSRHGLGQALGLSAGSAGPSASVHRSRLWPLGGPERQERLRPATERSRVGPRLRARLRPGHRRVGASHVHDGHEAVGQSVSHSAVPRRPQA